MNFALFSFITLAAASVAGSARSASTKASENLTIRTFTGTYTSLVEDDFPKTRQFRSIAFAKPPVQSRRWLPPQKLPASSEHHDSYDLPPSCPQFVTKVPSLMNQYLAEGALIYNGNQNHSSGLSGADTSEDCLYLAIWTPTNATAEAKLPVLFFMTGGGFQSGGINLPYQLPTEWIERSQSHIVVTINYRLNIFGFPNAPDLSDQNLGLLDQRTALEWVRDNIAQFGGDPERIVQWGQSAGAVSADALAHAFYEDPIANAYFFQSGTVFSGAAVADTVHSNFSFVARHFGCASVSANESVAELDCMRQVSFDDIENFIGQYGDNGEVPALSWLPVADERVIFSDYAARARAGQVAHRPTILSTTANELSSLVPWPTENQTVGLPQSIITAYDLAQFVCPTFNSTVERNQFNIPVFRYQYAGIYPNLNPVEWLGAYHGSDVPINFGTYDLVKTLDNASDFEVQVSRAIQDHILAFAKDPQNGPQKIGWNPMDAGSANGGELLRFGADEKVVQHVNGVEVDGPCQGVGEYDPFP